MDTHKTSLKTLAEQVRERLSARRNDRHSAFEAGTLSLTMMHETVGSGHPVAQALKDAVSSDDVMRIIGICRTVIVLYDQGALVSPRLRIAKELEGDLLNTAEQQVKASEASSGAAHQQTQWAVAAFLAGAALEDALRRLCGKHGVSYDASRATISKLQSALYSPSNGVEHISASETKQITAWGDTRNKADHGKFADLNQTDVTMMVMGVRAFIDRHLP